MLAGISRRANRTSVPQITFALSRLFSSPADPHVFDHTDTIVGSYTPVTKKLWQQRYRWNADSLAAAEAQTVFTPKPSTPIEVVYPFSTDMVLREHFRNPWGGVRIGLLLEDLDSMAGFTSYAHVDDGCPSTRPPVLATATVETINVSARPLQLDKDTKLSGRVIWTGNSSMDLLIEVTQGEDENALPNISALFTFVARDAMTGKAHRINPVQPIDEQGKQLFAQRQAIADARKAERLAQAQAGHRYTAEQVAWSKDLLSHSHLKRDMPALAEYSSIMMDQTNLENTFTTQPSQRNLHGHIFGGFLMRRAFELAHSTGYLLAACRPRTLLVDEIQFKRPVDIGDLVRFKSRVLKAWEDPTPNDPARGMAHVQVAASVVRPELLQSFESNTFIFLFSVRRRKDAEGKLLPLPTILPTTEAEANEVCEFYGPGSEEKQERWRSHALSHAQTL